MKYLALLGVAATLVFCPMSAPETQAAVEALTLKDLSLRSPLIIKGRVLSARVHWLKDAHGESIVTDYTVAVSEVLKSPDASTSKKLTLRCVGGRIGNTMMIAAVEPIVETGESVVLFAWPDPQARPGSGIYKTYGGFQGKFSLLGDRVRESRERRWAEMRLEVQNYLSEAKKK